MPVEVIIGEGGEYFRASMYRYRNAGRDAERVPHPPKSGLQVASDVVHEDLGGGVFGAPRVYLADQIRQRGSVENV